MSEDENAHVRLIRRASWKALLLATTLVLACGGTTASVETASNEVGDETDDEAEAVPPPDPCSEPLDQTACFDHVRDLAADSEVSAATVLSTMQRACAVRPRVVPSCLHVRDAPLEAGSYEAASLFALFCAQCAEEPEHSSCGFDTRLAETRDAIVGRCARYETDACRRLLGMREHACAADERDDALLASMYRRLNPPELNRFYMIASPQPLPADARTYDFVPRPPNLVFGHLGDEGLQLNRSDRTLAGSPFEADGLPAISRDGRFIASGRITGQGTTRVLSVAILRADDATLERTLELGEEDEDEELSDSQSRARDRRHRAAARSAARFLARGGFRTLAPINPPSTSDNQVARGVPLLATERTRIVVREVGPGAIRWAGEMPADQSGLLASEPIPDGCTSGLVEVGAWLYPDGAQMLLRAVYNAAGSECPTFTTFARVELAPG